MVFLSAIEDFVLRTLARLPGRMDRLEHLASLRQGEEYEHWGLARVHGLTAARQALAKAHTDAVLEVLRTPVRSLSEELKASPEERVEGWLKSAENLTPADLGGGAKTHVSSILVALCYLWKRPQSSNRPGA